MKHFTAKLTLISALLCAVKSQAFAQTITQNPEPESWYQVEMIIFSRAENSQNNLEHWSKNLQLHYPQNIQFLTTAEDARKLPPIDVNTNELATTDSANNTNTQTTPSDTDAVNKTLITTDTDANQEEKPFVLLDKTQLTLNAEAKRINRHPHLRVMLHSAWRQTVPKDTVQPWIVILGGDQFDQHYELEGSINLTRSRYLHLKTDLWLTRFSANYGQESQHWPPLPATPTAPAVIVVTPNSPTPESHDADATTSITKATPTPQQAHADNNNISAYQALINNNDLGIKLTSSSEQLHTLDDTYSSDQGSSWQQGLSYKNSWSINHDAASDTDEKSPQAYIIDEIIHVKQKRRMRSQELHYIDHPRLGILINITPYEKPEKKKAEAIDNL